FDSSVEDIFTTLISGAKLVLIKQTNVFDLQYLEELIKENNTTHFLIIPNFYNTFLEEISGSLKNLKAVVVAGDSFTEAFVKKHFEKLPQVKLYNEYGPTENSVCTTAYEFSPEKTAVRIGKPIHNVKCYILDKTGNPAPIGAPGELYVAGRGLTRGYLKRESLTREKFVENPVLPGERLYRTGDLAKWHTDGNIEFLGRIDNQVKIRGFRIELEEIQNRLMEIENVKEAVVVKKTEETGQEYLGAYYIADSEITDLRLCLAERLPEYMLPSYFVRLDKIPVTPNGKIDKKALPQPGADASEYAPPGNEIEEMLVDLWCEILEKDKEQMGVNSNFFTLGGHSLKAIILVSRLHKEINVKIPLVELFKAPTIRKLSQYIRGLKKNRFVSIKPVESSAHYPLSPAQKRLYFVNKMNPSNINYNVPLVMDMEGDISKDKIENTFRQLIERHESLRTAYILVEGEPAQKICSFSEIDFHMDYYECDEAEAEQVIASYMRPFDLSRPPLLRAGLIRLQQEKHIILFDMHHIITDGVSYKIFADEFMAVYAGEQLPPLKITYKDFAQWQNNLVRSGEIENQENYWLQQYKNLPPALNLKTDFPEPKEQNAAGEHVHLIIEAETAANVRELNEKKQTTLYMLLLAVLNVLLSKYSGQEDLVVGSPITGRNHTEVENIIGMFIGQLAMRNRPEGRKTFEDFLCEVKENALNAFDNQDYQYDQLVSKLGFKRDFGKNPLFNVVFAVQNMPAAGVEIENIKLSHHGYVGRTSKTDLRLEVMELGDSRDSIQLTLTYATSLFKHETAEKLLHRCVDILKQVLQDPGIRLGEIKLSHALASADSQEREEDGGDFDF
ncbi:MAG: AMP-binding protein, partial [bacterium]|nr:AMP-binding protein [bacterium]